MNEVTEALAGRRLMKGNVAAVYGALLAGCRSFYGYPITPASELPETAARLFPRCGATFLQAESEMAAVNMLYGAASAGERTMTASSSPGISLMMEGVSYAAGSELPMVIVDVMRGGPGLGNIGPEQGDYFQVVKGGGHGNYRNLVVAPASAQEMADFTRLAFELADRYRNPAFVLTDGFIGQMMEPVSLSLDPPIVPARPWAVCGTASTRKNLITSIFLNHEMLETHVKHLHRKYDDAVMREIRYEERCLDGAEILLIGYGIVSRVLRRVTTLCREKGIPVGLLRPITLWPFPAPRIAQLVQQVRGILVVELSVGQMVEDVRLAVQGRCPVAFYGRQGGMVPSAEEIVDQVIAFRESLPGREVRRARTVA
jgi:pyruvate/2-oxoacid:ferredoxin oxidoreductase alpha subunit